MCAFGFILSIFALCTPAQTPNDLQQIATEDGKQEMIPIKAVEFKAVETDPGFTLPAASVNKVSPWAWNRVASVSENSSRLA